MRNLPHHKWQFVFFDAQPASWQDTNTLERFMSKLGSVASNLIAAADNFGPHFAASVKAVATRNNNELRPLVPNATPYQQALDQMFKEVKRLVKGEFLRHLLKQATLRCHARSTDKLPHPTYEELGDIVEQVCIQLNTTDNVARSWRLCGQQGTSRSQKRPKWGADKAVITNRGGEGPEARSQQRGGVQMPEVTNKGVQKLEMRKGGGGSGCHCSRFFPKSLVMYPFSACFPEVQQFTLFGSFR